MPMPSEYPGKSDPYYEKSNYFCTADSLVQLLERAYQIQAKPSGYFLRTSTSGDSKGPNTVLHENFLIQKRLE